MYYSTLYILNYFIAGLPSTYNYHTLYITLYELSKSLIIPYLLKTEFFVNNILAHNNLQKLLSDNLLLINPVTIQL